MLLIGLVVLMSLLTFRLIARPISRLADQASRIATGETSAHLTQTNETSQRPRTVEIARLQEAITDMATTLEQRATYLQDFARHVSHEFKTPIAGIRGAIEILQDHREDMDEGQQLRFLNNIAADAARLHRLTERLMELTRAEIDTQQAQPFDLAATVADAISGFSHQIAFRTEGIDTDSHPLGNAAVVSAVLEILFENAIQQNATELTLWLEEEGLEKEGLGGSVAQLFISDNGNGVSASNREHVFTPFFTTLREQGGTGLGLTIAQALIKQIDGSLSLVAGNGPTTFRLTLRQS